MWRDRCTRYSRQRPFLPSWRCCPQWIFHLDILQHYCRPEFNPLLFVKCGIYKMRQTWHLIWLFACDWAQNEWWWQIVWENQPDLGSILGQSVTWTTSHTLSSKMSFWIYKRHQKKYRPPYWLPVIVLNGSAMAAARMSSYNVVPAARLPFSYKVLLFVCFQPLLLPLFFLLWFALVIVFQTILALFS